MAVLTVEAVQGGLSVKDALLKINDYEAVAAAVLTAAEKRGCDIDSILAKRTRVVRSSIVSPPEDHARPN